MGSRKNARLNRRILAGTLILAVFTALAVLVPLLSPYSSTGMNPSIQNQGISFAHLFGTDKFGRDIFVRVWSGAGISLMIGASSMVVNGCIGILYGSAAGYAGGKTDFLLMRAADIISSIPSMLYVILISLVMGSGVLSIIVGISVAGWIDTARITRGEVLRVKETDYIAAARMEGIHPFRILWKHLFPNIAGPVIVNLTFLVPQAIFTEAFLSFLGVGLSEPTASLGTMIQDARSQIQLYPGQMLFPILILSVLILAVNLIGTGMEERYGG